MGKAERKAATERVAAYHEARLAELFQHVSSAADRYRANEIDIYSMDEVVHHYHHAAQELWKFCWARGGGSHTEFVASTIERMTADGHEPIDWWERGAPRRARWSSTSETPG